MAVILVALGDVVLGVIGSGSVAAVSALTILASRRGQRAQASLSDAEALKVQSETAMNWSTLATAARDRAEKVGQLADILRQWQFEATPLLLHCARAQPDSAAAILRLLGINEAATRNANEARETANAEEREAIKGGNGGPPVDGPEV